MKQIAIVLGFALLSNLHALVGNPPAILRDVAVRLTNVEKKIDAWESTHLKTILDTSVGGFGAPPPTRSPRVYLEQQLPDLAHRPPLPPGFDRVRAPSGTATPRLSDNQDDLVDVSSEGEGMQLSTQSILSGGGEVCCTYPVPDR